MHRLLITGGSGYLGSELVRQAAPSPHWEVIATYCANPDPIGGVKAVPLDLRSPSAVLGLLEELRPDIVIHTAYVQSGPELDAITARGAGAVAAAARGVGARLIHMSSDVIFDGEVGAPYDEDADPSPISPYGAAKAEAERLVAAEHPGALIVRTSLIYGGAELSKHEQLALDAADGRADVTFFTDEIRCPVQVTDLALALLELAPADWRGRLNLAGADAISRYEFARLVAAAHGRDIGRLRAGSSAASGLRRPRDCALDSRRSRRLLRSALRGAREVLTPAV